jgi:hypothetical protein
MKTFAGALHFRNPKSQATTQCFPHSCFQIPFLPSKSGQIKKTHCGKSIFRDLLGVDYEIDGETVSAAWFTRNLNEFQLELEKLTGLKFDGGVSSS